MIAHSEITGATLVASLHAVDLALKWFPRIVGMRAGSVSFDLPAAQVTRTMLHQLYATEGSVLPTQGNDPDALRMHKGEPPTGANVVPLSRPGCR